MGDSGPAQWPEITLEDVHETVRSINLSKAPDSNGFPPVVWQKTWIIVKER
jgi:hypothetical protein